jgi:predicted MPP superfamily phosphohydrolase
MSDLHLDGLDGLTERVQELLEGTSADLCLIGGDFRMETYGPQDEAISRFVRLLPHIRVRDGIIGVLGNHDCLEMIGPLARAGVDILLNDAVAIARNGQRIWVVGIDEPHHYRCEDLPKAFAAIPPKEFVVFLAHSPEVYREAERFGACIYLCGHTHAGQVQILPLGPIFTHSRTGRRFVHGRWHYGAMQGYTSSGVGVSGVPVRFFSHGEMVRITLRRE